MPYIILFIFLFLFFSLKGKLAGHFIGEQLQMHKFPKNSPQAKLLEEIWDLKACSATILVAEIDKLIDGENLGRKDYLKRQKELKNMSLEEKNQYLKRILREYVENINDPENEELYGKVYALDFPFEFWHKICCDGCIRPWAIGCDWSDEDMKKFINVSSEYQRKLRQILYDAGVSFAADMAKITQDVNAAAERGEEDDWEVGPNLEMIPIKKKK